MKLTPALLLLTASSTLAQTSTPHSTVHRTTSATSAAASSACAKLPDLSPKIPALPSGSACPKPLYTLEPPTVKLAYASPMEGPDLREQLGLENSTISLDYVDAKVGTGELVSPRKWLSIHYTGYLVDGTKFDSSVDRGEPIDIPYGAHQVILGWDTGFGGMRVGGKRRLFIPYQLAYGPSQHQTIPPKSMLIFDVELMKVSDTPPVRKTPPAPVATPPAAGTPQPAPRPTTIPGAGMTPTPDGTKPAPPAPATDPTKPTATPPPPSSKP